MYLESFGLKKKPFSLTSDPSMLYFTDSHREALAVLCYGLLERKGLILLLARARGHRKNDPAGPGCSGAASQPGPVCIHRQPHLHLGGVHGDSAVGLRHSGDSGQQASATGAIRKTSAANTDGR